MILWMPRGLPTVKTEARIHAPHQSASFTSQQIKQTHRFDRQALYMPKSVDAPDFRSTVETPLMLGMSQYCDQWRCQKLSDWS